VDDGPGGTDDSTTRISEIPTVQSVRSSAAVLKINLVLVTMPHQAHPPVGADAAAPEGELGHLPERELRPGRVGVGIQRAADRVQLDQ
jgi:hypothetical protein